MELYSSSSLTSKYNENVGIRAGNKSRVDCHWSIGDRLVAVSFPKVGDATLEWDTR